MVIVTIETPDGTVETEVESLAEITITVHGDDEAEFSLLDLLIAEHNRDGAYAATECPQ
jgi:hypothetical protein